MEIKRMAAWRQLLEEVGNGILPFVCLQYKDKEAVQHNIPAVYIGKLSSISAEKIVNMVRIKKILFICLDELKMFYIVKL